VILFLDFDGVLHPDPCYDRRRLFEHGPRLAEVLSGFPDVRLVLSTQWRLVYPLEQLLAHLPQPVRDRVIGCTPPFNQIEVPAALLPYPRQAECAYWLAQNGGPEQPWVAVDDRPLWFVPYCDNLITCNPAVGLDLETAQRLGSHLIRKSGRQAHDPGSRS
jgi:hypothetical protein